MLACCFLYVNTARPNSSSLAHSLLCFTSYHLDHLVPFLVDHPFKIHPHCASYPNLGFNLHSRAILVIIGLRIVFESSTSSTSLLRIRRDTRSSIVDCLVSVGRRRPSLALVSSTTFRTLARLEFRQVIAVALIDKHLNCTESNGQALCDLSEDFMQ